MDEILSWEEIERRYADEWVALADPVVTDDLEIVRGRVIYHGPSYEAAHATLNSVPHDVGAIEFLGPITTNGVPVIL